MNGSLAIDKQVFFLLQFKQGQSKITTGISLGKVKSVSKDIRKCLIKGLWTNKNGLSREVKEKNKLDKIQLDKISHFFTKEKALLLVATHPIFTGRSLQNST